MNNKRIVCFTESMAGGGAEHQMALLANFLDERGYKVSLITYTDVPDHYPINNTIYREVLGKGKGKIGKVFSIFSFFIKIKTDCVITFRQSCNTRCLFPLLFRPKINVIAGERNTTKGAPDKYEKVLFGFLYRRANWIVANSFTQRDYLHNLKPQWKSKTLTIINFTELNLFVSDESVYNEIGPIKIGVFARFSRQKNFENFASMLRLLKQKTDKEFKVTWYGQTLSVNGTHNEDFLRAQKLVQENEIEDVIELKQAVKDVSSLITNFHAICLPSLYEGFSNSVAEGICAGRPMLVSNVSDNKRMVKNGYNGFLFDPENVNDMCKAFISFFNLDMPSMAQLGRNSREMAEELFKKDEFVNSYVRLIEY